MKNKIVFQKKEIYLLIVILVAFLVFVLLGFGWQRQALQKQYEDFINTYCVCQEQPKIIVPNFTINTGDMHVQNKDNS